MDLAHWLTIAMLCASGAMTPGPSLVVVLERTVSGGRAEGLRVALGHGLGVGIYAFGAVAGFSAVVAAVPGLHGLVSVVGALVLVWMGIGSWRAASGQGGEDEPGRRELRGFAAGFSISFLNPKIAVFFLALLGSFVPEQAGLSTRAGVALLAWGIDTTWYLLAALVLQGSGGAAWLSARQAVVRRVSAVILVFAAILVFLELFVS